MSKVKLLYSGNKTHEVLGHIVIACEDPNKAAGFYNGVLATLGIKPFFNFEGAVSYGEANGPKTFLLKPFDDGTPRSDNEELISFVASTRAQVDAFHATALELGGIGEGAPSLSPHYHENYYDACVCDPEGNKLQAVCHSKHG